MGRVSRSSHVKTHTSHNYRTCSRWDNKKQKNIDECPVNFPPRLESRLNARIVQKDAHKTATFRFLLPPGFTRFNSTLTPLFFYTPSFQESCSQSSIARRLPLGAFLHAAQIYGLPTAFQLISVVEHVGICTCVCYVEDREHCVPGTSEGVKQAITSGEGRGEIGGKTYISARMWWLLHVTQSKRVLLEVLWSDTDFNSP